MIAALTGYQLPRGLFIAFSLVVATLAWPPFMSLYKAPCVGTQPTSAAGQQWLNGSVHIISEVTSANSSLVAPPCHVAGRQ